MMVSTVSIRNESEACKRLKENFTQSGDQKILDFLKYKLRQENITYLKGSNSKIRGGRDDHREST